MRPSACKKHLFSSHNGYLIDPRLGSAQTRLGIGHTAGIQPWSDPLLHAHTQSEEFYLLVRGELRFLVGEIQLDLRERELLLVRPDVVHAILGGEGIIEHFGMRAPARDDKSVRGEIPVKIPDLSTNPRELLGAWGARLPLTCQENQNCWLLGGGTARVASQFISLAYLNFPSAQAANAGIGTRHRLHYHELCWEYYLVLEGEKTLQVGEELVTISPGEMLEVPPGVPHTLHSRMAPYEGFTIRAPVALGDKVVV